MKLNNEKTVKLDFLDVDGLIEVLELCIKDDRDIPLWDMLNIYSKGKIK